MKLLEVIATLGPGGAEALVCDLSIALAGLGVEVKVLLLAGLRGDRGRFFEERLNNAGIEIIGSEPRRVASISNLCSIIKTIHNWSPDVVHCHMYNAELSAVIGRMFIGGKRPYFVRTLHSTEFVGYRSKFISFLLTKAFDRHVTCADAVHRTYLDYIGRSSDSRVVAIPNGCTLAPVRTTSLQQHAAREKLRIGTDTKVVCHVGGFRGKTLAHGAKAHDVLLKSFAEAFRGNPEVVLVCAGDGPLRGEAEVLAVTLGIAEQTMFLGNITEPWGLLQSSDIFALPSRHEGLSLALLEAVSTGLPVVASEIPEIKTVCDGEGYLFCPVDDVAAFSAAFRKVVANLAHYTTAAEKGAVAVRQNYSIGVCAQRYWDEFNTMLELRCVTRKEMP